MINTIISQNNLALVLNACMEVNTIIDNIKFANC
jgi:hypothetical protein